MLFYGNYRSAMPIPAHEHVSVSAKASAHVSHLYLADDARAIPYGHCNLVDLSLSQQAHIDSLLDDVMKIEKPDYEAQARSIKGGVLHHKQELNAEQVGLYCYIPKLYLI